MFENGWVKMFEKKKEIESSCCNIESKASNK